MYLLEVRADPLGYAVVGRYSGRIYFTSTDRILANAVRDIMYEIKGFTDHEYVIRQKTCPHDHEIQERSMGGWCSTWICEDCGRERA